MGRNLRRILITKGFKLIPSHSTTKILLIGVWLTYTKTFRKWNCYFKMFYEQLQKCQRSCFYLLLYIIYIFKIKSTQFGKFLSPLKMYISSGAKTASDATEIIFTLNNHLDNQTTLTVKLFWCFWNSNHKSNLMDNSSLSKCSSPEISKIIITTPNNEALFVYIKQILAKVIKMELQRTLRYNP